MIDTQQTIQQALALHRDGHLDEAVELYRRVLEAEPASADARYLLGVIAHQRGDLAAAARWIEEALQFNPRFAAAHSALSVVRLARGEVDAAVASAERAVALTPEAADVRFNHANALRAAGRLEEACDGYRRAVALNGNYPEASNNLGVALERLGRMEEAREALLDALRVVPGYLDARANLGKVLYLGGDLAGAGEAFDEVLRVQPDHPSANLNRALLALLHGRFAEGWPLYERRAELPGAGIPQLPGEPWGGEPLDGELLLLHGEQGLGDTLQFVRYLPLVVARGGRVLLLVQRPLAGLLRGLAGVERLIAEGEPLPSYHKRVSLLSLPGIFASTEETIPNSLPYLPPPPTLRPPLLQALEGLDRPRVGVVWAGNPDHENDHNRSIPVRLLAPLLALEGITWVSLQKGAAEADAPSGVRPMGPLLEAFTDTAALLEELDLVITVDTSVAHLAGAMGRPVWLLLPLVPDWRWLLDRDDSPWYPGVMRLFRQRRFGDWEGVVSRLLEALVEWRREQG